jgi:hypothetical protein
MAADPGPQLFVCLTDVDRFSVVVKEGVYTELVVSKWNLFPGLGVENALV